MSRKAYSWVPSLYLMQGLPYALVTAVAPIIYKNLNIANGKIALFTSLFALPWFLKPLFAPVCEIFHSKRKLIFNLQFFLGILTLLLALSLQLKNNFYLSGLIFFAMATTSAIHDINADGIYLLTLDKKSQAQFIGVKTLFFQIGKMLAQFGFVFMAGFFLLTSSASFAWQITLFFSGLFIFGMAYFNKKYLPEDEHNGKCHPECSRALFAREHATKDLQIKNSSRILRTKMTEVITEFLKFPNLFTIIIFLIFYNFPEAQLYKIVPLFLLESAANGGLHLSVQLVAVIYGGLGVIAMLLGVMLSSFLLSQFTLKNCLLPMTIFALLTNLGYIYLTLFSVQNLYVIVSVVTLAQFGFGICNGAYLLYLLNAFIHGKNVISLYSIGSDLMGLGFVLGGATSGYLQSIFGYAGFFIWIVVSSIFVLIISIYNVKKLL